MNNMKMRQEFIDYLINRGYKQYTPSHLPSTVYQYAASIDMVIDWERLYDWQQIADNINSLCVKYDIGGEKEILGAKSHNTVISALKRFREFCFFCALEARKYTY